MTTTGKRRVIDRKKTAGKNEPMWARKLRELAVNHNTTNEEEPDSTLTDGCEEDVQAKLQALNFTEDQKKQAELIESHPSYASIPVFFKARPRMKDIEPESTLGVFKTVALKEMLQKRSELAWNSQVLQLLWERLQEHGIRNNINDNDPSNATLDFKGYSKVRSELMDESNLDVGVEMDPFLTNAAFFRLPKDENGRILIGKFFDYMLKKVTLYQTRIDLMYYETQSSGYLQEVDLQKYLFELVPSLPALSPLPKTFYRYYVCAAVRKFFFFLDVPKRGEIKIDEIVQSPVMAEFCQMTTASENDEVVGNWFSASTYAKIYDLYVTLDENRNGMLSKEELLKYDDGGYTKLFIDRVFEVSQTYGGEMDYKKYIDFVLVVKNKESKPAFEILWKVLDIYETGQLTPEVVLTFYKEITKKYLENNCGPIPKAEDVLTEIWDIVKPASPHAIHKKDLERCKSRALVCGMLSNWREFWRYDNRESLGPNTAAQPDDETKYAKLCSEIEVCSPKNMLENNNK